MDLQLKYLGVGKGGAQGARARDIEKGEAEPSCQALSSSAFGRSAAEGCHHRAVVGKPHVILADEPTGNLDSKNGMEVMQLLSELNEEGTTIVMVTHSKHDATYASRIINLFDGQVVDAVNDQL